MSSWHSKPLPRLLEELDARPGGLSQHQAEERLRRAGPNELEPPPQAGLLGRLLEQLRDPMILVLLGAAGLSLAASGGEEWLDAAIILVIVAVNSVISIFQEDRAQHALEELRRLSAPQATALRGGRPVKLPAAQLVPGDVILLEAGDLVPADARILECSRLQADESAMTGESIPVEKAPAEALAEDAPLGDWTNMVISGTLITAGRGTALVCATGMDTQMGHIAGLLLGDEGTDTPLQQKMGEISQTLSFLCLSVCAVMFGVGLIQGKRMLDMFLTAVSLAVAAIPEGLPAIVTIVLALGVGRMAARGAIVKKLPAVETLGCAGVICSDKTGTLTQNRMTVQEVWIPAGGRRRDALLAGALCNDARLEWRAGAPALHSSRASLHRAPASSASLRRPPAGIHTSCTVIRFWVRVPVLSEQITPAHPKVSTAGSFLTMAPRAAIRPTPRASTMVTMAGRPSGMAATARDTAVRNISSIRFPWIKPTPNMTAHTDRHRKDRVWEISPIFC